MRLSCINYDKLTPDSPSSITLIAHIYNEEYLLPFWLEHHKHIFDNAVIIDYNSTDKSRDIIKEICPTWSIIQSRNDKFDARNIDEEVMDIERTIIGYKITLNVTEFLLLSKKLYLPSSLSCFNISMINALSSEENIFPNTLSSFFSGIEKISFNSGPIYRGNGRFLHNYETGKYHIGRHHTNLNVSQTELNAVILWVGMYPWNDKTVERKMQIKHKISTHDRIHNFGTQHFFTKEHLYDIRKEMLSSGQFISDIPNRFKELITYIQTR